jgi:DNA-binding MarR family transcriptional regulator
VDRSAGGGALPTDRALFFQLVRVVNLTARPFVETLSRRHRLSLNAWRVMVVLASHPGVAAREVVDHTGLDKMSVSRAIASLARDGRVVRAADPTDARRTRLWLSDAGQALYRTIGESGMQREQVLFAGIGEHERRQMQATVEKMIAALGGAVPDAASRRRR